jgi:hypothetical protein
VGCIPLDLGPEGFDIGGARTARGGLRCLRGSAGLGFRMNIGWPGFEVGVRPFEGGPEGVRPDGEALMMASE